MASLEVFILSLYAFSAVSGSHMQGGLMTFRPRGKNLDGSITVDFKYKEAFISQNDYLYWSCSSGGCGYESYSRSGPVDESRYPYSWYQKEVHSVRHLSSGNAFQLRASGCCWVGNRVSAGGWSLITDVDLGTRSDTFRPNHSPVTTILPILRVPKNCPTSFKLMAHDPDGDIVRCRYGDHGTGECDACFRDPNFHLDQGRCVLSTISGLSVGAYVFELVLQDFPQKDIKLTYSDGSVRYKYQHYVRKSREVPKNARWYTNSFTDLTEDSSFPADTNTLTFDDTTLPYTMHHRETSVKRSSTANTPEETSWDRLQSSTHNIEQTTTVFTTEDYRDSSILQDTTWDRAENTPHYTPHVTRDTARVTTDTSIRVEPSTAHTVMQTVVFTTKDHKDSSTLQDDTTWHRPENTPRSTPDITTDTARVTTDTSIRVEPSSAHTVMQTVVFTTKDHRDPSTLQDETTWHRPENTPRSTPDITTDTARETTDSNITDEVSTAGTTVDKDRVTTTDDTRFPTSYKTRFPTIGETRFPTNYKTRVPTIDETRLPTIYETRVPTTEDTRVPTTDETQVPTTDETRVPTTDETRVPTSEEARSPTNDETRVPTTDETQVPTSDEVRSPTSDETRVPTTDDTRVPTTDETRVPTSDEARSPTSDETRVPTTDDTQVPTTDETRVPTTDETRVPTSDEARSPTNDETRVPTSDEARLPTNDETRVPTTYETRVPTTDEARIPTNDETRVPTSDEARSPTNDETRVPTSDEARLPTSDETRVPTIYETRVPTTDEARLPTNDETRVPTTGETRVPTTDEARLPTNDETRVPTSDEARSPTNDETRVPTSDEARLPTSDETRGPTTYETRVPTIEETILPTTGEIRVTTPVKMITEVTSTTNHYSTHHVSGDFTDSIPTLTYQSTTEAITMPETTEAITMPETPEVGTNLKSTQLWTLSRTTTDIYESIYPTYDPTLISLSKIPLQFIVEVTASISSCDYGVFRPKFISPTPRQGEILHARAGTPFQLHLSAQATQDSISDFKVSGPVNITKRFTSNTQSSSSMTVEWTPSEEDIGDHVPFCFFAETVQWHSSELRCVLVIIDSKILNTVLTCNENTMTLVIKKTSTDGLYDNHLRLNDPMCLLSSNSTHHVASVGFNSCGTEVKETEHEIVFKNKVTSFDEASAVISRKHQVIIPFNCSFPKKSRVSASFRAQKAVFEFTEAAFGNFTYKFQFYTNDQFLIVQTQTPLEVMLRDMLYMEIQVTSSLPNVQLFVESCRATPHDNPNDPVFYNIIDNGCLMDETLVIYRGSNTQSRFGMEAFAFIGDHEEVYLSCTVILCKLGDPNTRCARGCISKSSVEPESRRRKRSLTSEATESLQHFISQGPMRMKRQSSSEDSDGKVTLNVNTLVMSLSGVIAVALAATTIITYKKRVSLGQYQRLPTDDL